MRTYDILNAGPKHRFMAGGRIVSNSGRIFQPQNLPRSPDWFDGQVQETTIAAFKADAEDILWADVSERCAFAVRGCLIAEANKKLVIADLSNIEGRVLAWLAGEHWKIEAFKAYDRGDGPDLYKVTAARILDKDVEDVTKAERQSPGKVSELSCGYQGSVGAFRKMGGARVEGMSDEGIQDIVWKWRTAHPRTKSLWYDLEGAAKMAIRSAEEGSGGSFDVRGLLRLDVVKDQCDRAWLRVRLPSGRYLCYLRPQIDSDSGQILYEGMNQYTRKWSLLETYGGKLVENSVQAIARDVFFAGLRRAEEAGYPVVLRVHDELVCEVPDDPAYSHERLAEMMSANPGWSTGLPLAAAGFEAYRYRKG